MSHDETDPETSPSAWLRTLQDRPAGHRVRGLGTLACLEYAPDGAHLATGGSLGVVLWDLAARRVRARFAREVAPVVALAFTRDGRRLAALGRHGGLAICELAGGPARVVQVDGAGGEDGDDFGAWRLQFAPAGDAVLVMADDCAWLVEDDEVRPLVGDDGDLAGLVAGFAADGEVVVLEERAVGLYARDDGELELARELEFRAGHPPAATSGDGRFLIARTVGGHPADFAVLSLETGEVVQTARLGDGLFNLCFAAAATRVFADLARGPVLLTLHGPTGDAVVAGFAGVGAGDLRALAPDGEVLASGDAYDGEIAFYAADGREVAPRLGRYIYASYSAVALTSLAADAGTAVLVGCVGDGQNSYAWAQAWDLVDDRPGPTLTDEAGVFCTSTATVPGTALVVVPRRDTGALLIDRATGEATRLTDAADMQCAAVDADGAVIAAGGADGDLVLWRRADAAQLACVHAHDEQICGVAWAGDAIATSSQDGSLRLWSARALQAEGRPRAGRAPKGRPTAIARVGGMLYAPAFAADGSLVAVGNDAGEVAVIAAADGQLVRRLAGHACEVMAVAFHPRSGELVTADLAGRVRVWEPRSGALRGELVYPSGDVSEGGVTGLGFSADGRVMVIAHADGTLRVWDLPA